VEVSSLAESGLQFIARCSTSDPVAAAQDFLSTAERIGFDVGAGGAWIGVGSNRKSRFFFVNWPTAWLEIYQANLWFQIDVMLIEARRRVGPFWFRNIVEHFKLTSRQKELCETFYAFGWKDCFAVPIHGPGSLQGLVTLATRQDLALSAADCAVLEMMSRAIWERCRLAEGFGVSDPRRPQLSSREIECLQWAAAGKSDTDIAAIVGIKPATAHFHIEQAKKRFGVKTRVEAVAAGVLHGMI
jgi:LuxR family quorum sensing-dependent transcriptional regulator